MLVRVEVFERCELTELAVDFGDTHCLETAAPCESGDRGVRGIGSTHSDKHRVAYSQ